MSMLSQRMLVITESIEHGDHIDTQNEETAQVMEENAVIPENKSDEELDKNSKPAPVDDRSYCEKINNVSSYDDIEELEDRIEIDRIFSNKGSVDAAVELNTFLTESVDYLERLSVSMKAKQYKILSESVDTEDRDAKLQTLLEDSGASLWQKLIAIIVTAISKIKDFASKLVFKAAIGLDVYGKWAVANEDNIRKTYKKTNFDYACKMHKWNHVKLFDVSDFSRIHDVASTIIGEATKKDDMKKKLDEFENRNWSNKDVYNYILSKSTGIKVKGDKEEALQCIVTEIRGKNAEHVTLSEKVINSYIKGLKSIKSQALAISSKSKLSLVNPRFDALLKEARMEANKYDKDPDSIRYKYFRARYSILSDAQQVAFDVYRLKMNLIKQYASELHGSLASYLKHANKSDKDVQNENAELLNMNQEIPNNAMVINEILV